MREKRGEREKIREKRGEREKMREEGERESNELIWSPFYHEKGPSI